jgi:hypothetical protein
MQGKTKKFRIRLSILISNNSDLELLNGPGGRAMIGVKNDYNNDPPQCN